MAKNAMLNAISKTQFTAIVIAATDKFKAIYEKGIVISENTYAPAPAVGKCKELIEAALKATSVAVKDALMKAALDGKKETAKVVSGTVNRYPNAGELAKQFVTFVPMACVVPTRNRNHHAYKLNQPVIMVHGADGANKEMFGMDGNGCIINRSTSASDGLSHLPRLRKSIRPATRYEIYDIIEKLYR